MGWHKRVSPLRLGVGTSGSLALWAWGDPAQSRRPAGGGCCTDASAVLAQGAGACGRSGAYAQPGR